MMDFLRASLQGCTAVFMLLTMVSKAATCEAPSSPQCFRRKSDETVYTCEWSMNTTESDVMFNLSFTDTLKAPFRTFTFKETKSGRLWSRYQFKEEQLIKYRPVHLRVIARTGNSSCTSPTTSVILSQSVKYEAPQDISVSWMGKDLNLSWRAAEKQPALAEVSFQRVGDPTEPWENNVATTNTTNETCGRSYIFSHPYSDKKAGSPEVCSQYGSGTVSHQVTVVNLQKHSAYRVQVRHQSTQAGNPLWSNWSLVVTVPAELEHAPEVTVTKRFRNGAQTVTLTWKPVPPAAAAGGVTYNITDTQCCHGCPCQRRNCFINTPNTNYTTNVTYSAVNISVIAINAAGKSPPAVVQVPAKPTADLKPCDKALREEQIHKKTCLEWYELQDGDSKPESVFTSLAKMTKAGRQKMTEQMKDNVRYLFFEHRCNNRRPQTVQMCLYYKSEGVPSSEPLDFIAFSETHTTANLSWKAIPLVHRRGFLTHYVMCRVKSNLQNEATECRNISALLVKYRLENLTPGTRYNISLAGVTRMGEGPKATVIINTAPGKPVNVWLSFGLLFLFFSLSIICTFIFKRVKNRILPPVPMPVIADSASYQPENQEKLQGKEVVHELTLCQLHPAGKPVETLEDSEETTFLGGTWRTDDGPEEDPDNERSDGSYKEKALRCTTDENMTDLEHVDNEIAMLIYRNGLVFDVKTDSG